VATDEAPHACSGMGKRAIGGCGKPVSVYAAEKALRSGPVLLDRGERSKRLLWRLGIESYKARTDTLTHPFAHPYREARRGGIP